jgi:mevalonate kinase
MTIEINHKSIEGYDRIYLRTNEIDRVEKILRGQFKHNESIIAQWEEAVDQITDTPQTGRTRFREIDITHVWSTLALLLRRINVVDIAIAIELLAYELFGDGTGKGSGGGGGGNTNPPPSVEPVVGFVNFTVPGPVVR